MSSVSTSRTQRKDNKSSASSQKQTHASAEEIRLAQIIDGNAPTEDSETQSNVATIMEVTGSTEDSARTALYDANNDTNRAIELILESGSTDQSSGWETAGSGRKKNKTSDKSVVRGVDTFDEEVKEDTSSSNNNWERSNSKGRGRGKSSRNRGKSNDKDRRTDDESRGGGSESRERQRGERRGRGRGGSSGRGGRQPGRFPRRFGRYNQNRGEYGNDHSSNIQNDYSSGYSTYTNSNTDTTQIWKNDDEDWGKLEVGTWSNEDAQKQNEKKAEPVENWGVESWNEDLLETKVFQSQNAQISPPISGSLPPQPNHIPVPGTAPQMGERIDLGALFKKNHAGAVADTGSSYPSHMSSESLMGQSGMVFNNSDSTQLSAPSVIQQLQQQGQSNSLFSDSKAVSDMDSKSSRLFGAYERQGSVSSANNSSAIGPFGSRNTESSFSQYNGKLGAESNESKTSELLGSFAEQFKSATEQGGRIGQMPKSAFTSITQNDNQGVSSSGSNYRNFSQAQQREATEAVKASLGLPAVSPLEAAVTQSEPSGIQSNEPIGSTTLSFGAPQPVRMQNKPRKKASTGPSKIPASAVEMPGAGSGGYLDFSNFDLQFGIDDSTSAPATIEFGNTNGPITAAGIASSQSSLFNNNAMSSSASLMNHMPPTNIEGASMFSSNLPAQNQAQALSSADPTLQTNDPISTSAPLHASQRYPESLKQNEPIRGPPGISHPPGLSTTASSGGGLVGLPGSTQQSSDLSSSGGSYGTGLMAASGNMPLSGLSHEASNEQSQNMSNPVHSFYASSSLGQPTQQHSMDLSTSSARNLRSPVTMTSLANNMQASPMSHINATPSKDKNGSNTSAMSSLTSGMAQTHVNPHVGGTPTKATSSSTPINILGSSPSGTTLGGNSNYASMKMGYNASSGPSIPSQTESISAAGSPGKHLSSNDLYSTTGLSSSLHHNHQDSSTVPSSSNPIGSALGSSILPMASTNPAKPSSSSASSASKAGPPNLTLGVPPLLPNQYGIPMGPGLMTAYTPEAALYGYAADPLMAVQSRVHQVPNYYDMYNASNPTANPASMNRESSTTTTTPGKFGRGEPSSPTSLIGMVNSASSAIAPQQHVTAAPHNAHAQLKVSQTGTHQAAQPFMNLPAAAAPAAYQGYGGLYYNAFQYPPMFAAAAAAPAVPNAPKHQVNTTAAFQQPATGFTNAYSTASMNASTANNLHDIQGQAYSKSHMQPFEKQQPAFHTHHTNTPPPAFNLQTLTAAMAAANTGAAAGAGPGMNPYTQAPFMTMLPTHQHSQIHVHLPQHGDAGQTVGSQRSQTSNSMGKTANKTPFGNTTAPYWGN